MAKDVARALGYASTNMTTVFQAVPEEWKGSNPIATPGGAQALGYERPNDAVNTHCEKSKDFRGVEMTATATPMQAIPGEWKGVHRMHTPGGGGG